MGLPWIRANVTRSIVALSIEATRGVCSMVS